MSSHSLTSALHALGRPAALLALLALGPTTGAGLTADLGLPGLSGELAELGAADAAFIRRNKLKKRATVGYKVVVVVGDDAETNEVDTVEVSIDALTDTDPTPSEDVVSLELRKIKANGNKRYVYRGLDFESDAVGAGYQLTTTMLDVAGEAVGETEVSDVTVEDDGPPKTRTPTITQLDASNFELQIKVVGDDDLEVARVDVEIVDLIGNAAIPDVFSFEESEDSKGRRVFTTSSLTFEDPASAADQPYGVVVTLYDSFGDVLGASDYEVVVEGLEV